MDDESSDDDESYDPSYKNAPPAVSMDVFQMENAGRLRTVPHDTGHSWRSIGGTR